jgi:hypothetical protein
MEIPRIIAIIILIIIMLPLVDYHQKYGERTDLGIISLIIVYVFAFAAADLLKEYVTDYVKITY